MSETYRKKSLAQVSENGVSPAFRESRAGWGVTTHNERSHLSSLHESRDTSMHDTLGSHQRRRKGEMRGGEGGREEECVGLEEKQGGKTARRRHNGGMDEKEYGGKKERKGGK